MTEAVVLALASLASVLAGAAGTSWRYRTRGPTMSSALVEAAEHVVRTQHVALDRLAADRDRLRVTVDRYHFLYGPLPVESAPADRGLRSTDSMSYDD